ncbi:hypothetical protein KIN34_00365 [Cellulomonas sp. DKR-3]|uniref:Uncharacterized protein n=1 Tax=Cellulomonas fulva TaxID=2835530 RepID=A0ABS5TUC6_9CELL|nr:hypothetical protein [Cellulomonas fulva]MBT0992743.1 hypothetical protein [Cellulomonas fulva]
MNDLRDLLHAAADELPTDGLRADALTGRVRRRRAARTATRSAVGVGAVGALALGAAQLQGGNRAADSVAGADDAEGAAITSVAPQTGAAPGACGWAVAAGAQADGTTITTSTTTGALRATVLPVDASATTPTGATLDTTVMLGSDEEDKARLTADAVTVLVTSDGVVVARHDVVVDGDSARVAQQAPWYLWTDVPLEACERSDGEGPTGPLDGDLAVWVLADVTRGDESALLLGGGTAIQVEQGEVPGYCGRTVGDLASDRSVALTGTADLGSLVDQEFVAGAPPLDVLRTSQQLDVVDPASRAAGALGSPRLLLTDAAGAVVSDSATSGADPGDRFGGWYDLPAVGQGGQLAADAVTCDGDPLPAGTYEAWGSMALAPWDPDLAAGPALGHLGTVTVP